MELLDNFKSLASLYFNCHTDVERHALLTTWIYREFERHLPSFPYPKTAKALSENFELTNIRIRAISNRLENAHSFVENTKSMFDLHPSFESVKTDEQLRFHLLMVGRMVRSIADQASQVMGNNMFVKQYERVFDNKNEFDWNQYLLYLVFNNCFLQEIFVQENHESKSFVLDVTYKSNSSDDDMTASDSSELSEILSDS